MTIPKRLEEVLEEQKNLKEANFWTDLGAVALTGLAVAQFGLDPAADAAAAGVDAAALGGEVAAGAEAATTGAEAVGTAEKGLSAAQKIRSTVTDATRAIKSKIPAPVQKAYGVGKQVLENKAKLDETQRALGLSPAADAGAQQAQQQAQQPTTPPVVMQQPVATQQAIQAPTPSQAPTQTAITPDQQASTSQNDQQNDQQTAPVQQPAAQQSYSQPEMVQQPMDQQTTYPQPASDQSAIATGLAGYDTASQFSDAQPQDQPQDQSQDQSQVTASFRRVSMTTSLENDAWLPELSNGFTASAAYNGSVNTDLSFALDYPEITKEALRRHPRPLRKQLKDVKDLSEAYGKEFVKTQLETAPAEVGLLAAPGVGEVADGAIEGGDVAAAAAKTVFKHPIKTFRVIKDIKDDVQSLPDAFKELVDKFKGTETPTPTVPTTPHPERDPHKRRERGPRHPFPSPNPSTIPAPSTIPETRPEPTRPAPAPTPAPAPSPIPEPVPEPEHVPEPMPAPEPAPSPEPTPAPTKRPEIEPHEEDEKEFTPGSGGEGGEPGDREPGSGEPDVNEPSASDKEPPKEPKTKYEEPMVAETEIQAPAPAVPKKNPQGFAVSEPMFVTRGPIMPQVVISSVNSDRLIELIKEDHYRNAEVLTNTNEKSTTWDIIKPTVWY